MMENRVHRFSFHGCHFSKDKKELQVLKETKELLDFLVHEDLLDFKYVMNVLCNECPFPFVNKKIKRKKKKKQILNWIILWLYSHNPPLDVILDPLL